MNREKFRSLVEGELPGLDQLLDDPELVKEWALAGIDASIAKSSAAAERAHSEGPGSNAEFLECMVDIGEREAERERILDDELDGSNYAQARWFDEAEHRLAIKELAVQAEGTDRLRQMLARRSLWNMGFIK